MTRLRVMHERKGGAPGHRTILKKAKTLEREKERERGKTLGEDCIKKNIERGGEELNGSYGR